MSLVARAVLLARGRRLAGGKWHSGHLDHYDAIDGAGRHAQLAAGAQCGNHGVHLPGRTHDRIDGTRRQALGAADAACLIDLGNEARAFDAMRRIQWQRRTAEQA